MHKMALDVLLGAPMSDEAERVFSSIRCTISFDPRRLGAERIEMTECLGSWKKNNYLIFDMHVS